MIKSKNQILQKLGIDSLNKMQIDSQSAIKSNKHIVILSPTGTGKTLAFLLPVIDLLNVSINEVQCLIISPTRELAIQIEQVARDMGTGFKVNAVYGGHSGYKDKKNIAHEPAILIGTPGRISDLIKRKIFSSKSISIVILDEFDKSLEIGFEKEIHSIFRNLPSLNKKILTSATSLINIPSFLELNNVYTVNYTGLKKINDIKINIIKSNNPDKIDALMTLINNIGDNNCIVFFNQKDSINQISNLFNKQSINHSVFHGGIEQIDRERALIKFRNKTNNILLATDLAARGIDVPNINFIVHFEIPKKENDFTHRNGRTGRVNSSGLVYIVTYSNDNLPSFIGDLPVLKLILKKKKRTEFWSTLLFTGGRKDKISKADIAGMLFKQGKLINGQIGLIELKNDCAFVSIKSSEVKEVLNRVNNIKLKKKKIRVSLI